MGESVFEMLENKMNLLRFSTSDSMSTSHLASSVSFQNSKSQDRIEESPSESSPYCENFSQAVASDKYPAIQPNEAANCKEVAVVHSSNLASNKDLTQLDFQLSVHVPSHHHQFLHLMDRCNKLKNSLRYSYEYSDREFLKDYSFLKHMGVIVPLSNSKVARYSRKNTFEYIPLHVRDPSLLDVETPCDHGLLSPQSADHSYLPHHSKKGISYEEGDLVEFQPEVSRTTSVFDL